MLPGGSRRSSGHGRPASASSWSTSPTPTSGSATIYADAAKFGTKADQYVGLERMLKMFPDLTWIGAHMGGDPEHPDHLEALLERYPHFYLDTSATKWQVREVSAHRDAIREPDVPLAGAFPVRLRPGDAPAPGARALRQPLLVPADLVGKHLGRPQSDRRSGLPRRAGQPATPLLRGLDLPDDVLELVYRANACRILPQASRGSKG